MPANFRIAAIGELLWDLLPSGPQLGGAPANFAAMSANVARTVSRESAGHVFLVSRVGDDALGRKAREQLSAHNVDPEFISIDPRHPTGAVTVTFTAEGSPAYCIHEPVAWDYMPGIPELFALAPTLDAVCFGTLAQRSDVSRGTLRRFIESTAAGCVRVFDVNLRAPYWTQEALAWGCARSTIVKMNLEEVSQLGHALGASPGEQNPLELAHFLLRRFAIRMVAITRGAEGSLLVTREETHDHAGVPAEVVDPIGAGDAFTAALTYSVLRHLPLALVAEAANRWGAWVAKQHGGMPIADRQFAKDVYSSYGG